MRPTDWLKRLDELGPRVAVVLGSGVGLGFVLLPGTVFGAALGLLGMGGLFVLGMSGRMLLVSVPRGESQAAGVPLMLPPSVPIPVPETETWTVTKGTTFTMKRLDGGEFWLGSRNDDAQAYRAEMPQHRVRVSPFSMMTVGVTRRLYRTVIKQAPPSNEEPELPIRGVRWFEAVTFCNALSENFGLRPCYQQTEAGWEWDRSADGFRLPTEAEREYATRAGSDSRWCFGDDETTLGNYAWFKGNSGGQPHLVGQKEPNAWGLHDLHGTVCEWCWDWFGPYSAEPASDPMGPAIGNDRVLRGGSYLDRPGNLRSARRDRIGPGVRDRNIGFRCVRSVSRQN